MFGYHHEDREPSDGSYVEEADLRSFAAAPAPAPPSHAGSVYGGIASSDYNQRPCKSHDNNHYEYAPRQAPYHTHVLVRAPLAQPQGQHRSLDPPTPPSRSYFLSSHSATSETYSNSTPAYDGGLPAFSRWSPTWVSGGVSSGDGKAFTHHPPKAYATSAGAGPWGSPAPARYRSATDADAASDAGWIPEPAYVGEWEAPGGEYRHGVGYETASTGSKQSTKVADRLRRLEREFGRPADATSVEKGPVSFKEQLEAARIDRIKQRGRMEEQTGLDRKGRLVVPGTRKRAALRWFQGLGAVGVALGSIGASLFTHPTATPPPDKSTPLFMLYLLPFLSLALTIYLFVFRPCVVRSKSKSRSPASANHLVMPLLGGQHQQPSGGSGCCCFGRRKGPKRGQPGQPTVNFVLDPSMFPHLLGQATPAPRTESREAREKRKRRRRRRARLAAEKEVAGRNANDNDELLSSGHESSSSDTDSDDDHAHHRMGGAVSLAQDQVKWQAARKTVKVLAWWDAASGLVWGAIAAWAIGFGKSCKPGAFQGWCNFYNSALALAVLLSLAFFTSLTLGCLDLRRTKEPPALLRHRATIP